MLISLTRSLALRVEVRCQLPCTRPAVMTQIAASNRVSTVPIPRRRKLRRVPGIGAGFSIVGSGAGDEERLGREPGDRLGVFRPAVAVDRLDEGRDRR